jgi:hypothetical protein
VWYSYIFHSPDLHTLSCIFKNAAEDPLTKDGGISLAASKSCDNAHAVLGQRLRRQRQLVVQKIGISTV